MFRTEDANRRIAVAGFLALAAGALAGCGSGPLTVPVVTHTATFKGIAHGGQQPIAGASVLLFAAGTSGYSAVKANLLTSTVVTDAGGAFNIPSGAFTCTAGQQIYLVATGGNPGAGTNTNQATMAALGDCSSINSQTYVSMNEITTVGSVYALAPFMSSYTSLGTSPTNTAGLARAFASVNKLVNVAGGTSLGSALPAGAVGPSTTVNALANVIAACINSAGGAAGSSTPCGSLFTLTTPPGGPAPTDVIQAALNIARNPAFNVADLYNSAPPASPFAPVLSQSPQDWTLSVNSPAASASRPQPPSTAAARCGSQIPAQTA